MPKTGLTRQRRLQHILKLPVYRRWDLYYDFCGITEINYQPDYGTWKLIRFNQKLS